MESSSCPDGCCQVAFCTICEEVMQPVDYYVNPKTQQIAVKVECPNCSQVAISGIRKNVLVNEDTKVLTTAVIRNLS